MYGLLLLLALLARGAPARAQPRAAEGYRSQAHPGLTVEWMPGLNDGVAAAIARDFPLAQAQVEQRLGLELPGPPHVVVAPTDAEFRRRFALLAGRRPANLPLAVAFPDFNRGYGVVIVRVSGVRQGTNAALDDTFQHELSHLALRQLERRIQRRLPSWLNEGLCEWASRRRLTPPDRAALVGSARSGQLPHMAELADGFPEHGGAGARAYLYAWSFVDWLDEQGGGGGRGVRAILHRLEAGETLDQAVAAVTGRRDVIACDIAWREELARDTAGFILGLLTSLPALSLASLLAIVAFARHWWLNRLRLAELAAEEAREDAEEAARLAAQDTEGKAPSSEPPTSEPPTSEPPTSEPPSSEPPRPPG